jgi:hypothetical protein
MSWASLDKTREEYQKKVDEDEKLLSQVIARLLRNKQILKRANERATQKTLCLASEMQESGELDKAQTAEPMDCPATNALVGFSPVVWETNGLIDASVAAAYSNPPFIPETPAGSQEQGVAS